jgi:hypothetical protein
MLSNVRGGRGIASRTVGLLGAIFTYAVRHGIRSGNPVHGFIRPRTAGASAALLAESTPSWVLGCARLQIRAMAGGGCPPHGTPRPPIAPDMISSGPHDHGANRSPRFDGPTQALRDEERRSLPSGWRSQIRGTRSSPRRSNASTNRNASPATCSRRKFPRSRHARSSTY